MIPVALQRLASLLVATVALSASIAIAGEWRYEKWSSHPANIGSIELKESSVGGPTLSLSSEVFDDARFVKSLSVKPDTWYRISALVSTTDVVSQGSVGANISVIGHQVIPNNLRGTHSNERLAVYVKSFPSEKEWDVALRLGFYSNLAKGSVTFSEFDLREESPPKVQASALGLQTDAKQFFAMDLFSTSILALLTLFYALLLTKANSQNLLDQLRVPRHAHLFAVFLIFFFVKIFIAGLYLGYPGDIRTFTAWSERLAALPFADFYEDGYFADYPPAYMYVLSLTGYLSSALTFDPGTPGFLRLLKLPAIFTDLAISAFLVFAGRLVEKPKLGLLLAVIWCFSPLAFLNSALWGQVDSVLALFVASALVSLEQRKLVLAAALYAVALSLKPQALMLAPLAAVAIWQFRSSASQMAKTVIAFLLVFCALIFPFAYTKDFFWIFSLYFNTLSSYQFLSLNAFNLYTLFGGNWVPLDRTFLGVGLGFWSFSLMGLGVLSVLVATVKSHVSGKYLYSAVALIVVMFVVGPKMHERYLYLAACLSLFVLFHVSNPRLIRLALMLALSSFLNSYVTLDLMASSGSSAFPSNSYILMLGSLLNIGLLVETLYCGYLYFLRRGPEANSHPPLSVLQVLVNRASKFIAPRNRVTFPFVHWFGRGLLVVGMASPLFYLGGMQSPQPGWDIKPNQQAVFELGRLDHVKSISYFQGLGSGLFSLDWSLDGVQWFGVQEINQPNRFAPFRWVSKDIDLRAKYLRVAGKTGSVGINEIRVLSRDGREIPLSIRRGSSDSRLLIDEAEIPLTPPTSYDSMIFDEVYFPRSALETLNGQPASETTHPPLGKLLITASISQLGMTPFAYRLPSVLLGSLSVLLLYWIALRLFRIEWLSAVAAALFALEFMRFTMSRIGTIDSVLVFFNLLAVAFLLQFVQENRSNPLGRKGLGYLALTGFAAGCGLATKWSALFNFSALCAFFVLYLWLFSKGRFGAASIDLPARAFSIKRAVLMGLVAFLLLPVAVVVASYVPEAINQDKNVVELTLESHRHMWAYHTLLKAEHPFSSRWYEWPLMSKPLWIYSGSAWVPPGFASTIVGFGNPVNWIIGSAAFAYLLMFTSARLLLSPRAAQTNSYLIVSITILMFGLAQFLPWTLSLRSLTFTYHFYPSVPFLILALVWSVFMFARRFRGVLLGGLLLLGFLLFVAFYPVISGYPTEISWLKTLSNSIPIKIFY